MCADSTRTHAWRWRSSPPVPGGTAASTTPPSWDSRGQRWTAASCSHGPRGFGTPTPTPCWTPAAATRPCAGSNRWRPSTKRARPMPRSGPRPCPQTADPLHTRRIAHADRQTCATPSEIPIERFSDMSIDALDHLNEVHLVGKVSAAPETRVLPSGDEILTWRLVVSRDMVADGRPVHDTID